MTFYVQKVKGQFYCVIKMWRKNIFGCELSTVTEYEEIVAVFPTTRLVGRFIFFLFFLHLVFFINGDWVLALLHYITVFYHQHFVYVTKL